MARVGGVIPNLYAAGEIADIVFMGESYAGCGTFNAWGVYSGKLAGASAAARTAR